MRRSLAIVAVLLCAGTLGTACGDETPGGADGDTIETIDIAFSDGTVTPSGDRVEIGAGQTVDLVVKSDEPGEIHVHSTPEQEFTYGTGTTTIRLQVDRPGIVEVESHDLEQVIVELVVR